MTPSDTGTDTDTDAGRKADSGTDAEYPYDDFLVRLSNETTGERIARTGKRVPLHNHENPCPAAQQLKASRVMRLGAQVAPRPELKRLCKACSWPVDRNELANAFLRTPERYR